MSSIAGVSRGVVLSAVLSIGISGGFFMSAEPARAEKSAEQIKCEEEGGSWVDKGNGNTFCFKKLPPMGRADGPSSGNDETCSAAPDAGRPVSAGGPTRCDHAISTKGTGVAGRAGPGDSDCDDSDPAVAEACRMAINEKGPRRPKPQPKE